MYHIYVAAFCCARDAKRRLENRHADSEVTSTSAVLSLTLMTGRGQHERIRTYLLQSRTTADL